MKLSERTIKVLKNFNTINQSLVVNPGNVLSTVSKSKNVLASVEVDETFDTPFAIYEISRFLGIVSLYKNPELTFGEDSLVVSERNNSVKYTYADPTQIVSPPQNTVTLPSVDVEFELKQADLDHVLRGASILGVDTIAFVGDGSKILLKAYDERNPTSDSTFAVIADSDLEFTAMYKTQILTMLPLDYNVKLCKDGVSQFSGQDNKVNYWIALESTSQF